VQRKWAASGKRGGQADSVLGQPGKLRIRAGMGQDLSVARRYRAPALAPE
jgi:hypothetical protein